MRCALRPTFHARLCPARAHARRRLRSHAEGRPGHCSLARPCAFSRSYASLPQRTVDGVDDRTEEEHTRFKNALGGINAWYGNRKTYVLLMTTPLPTGHAYTNTQPYLGRGWCVAEKYMSGMVKDDYALIDMAGLKGMEGSVEELRKNGRTLRPPPMAPDAFLKMLSAGVADGSIKFTNKGDVELVASIYSTSAPSSTSWGRRSSSTTRSSAGATRRLPTSPATAFEYAHANKALQKLKILSLYGNMFTDPPPLARGGKANALANLETLHLTQNKIDDTGLKKLASACASGGLPKLTRLNMGKRNPCTDAAKSSCIKACTCEIKTRKEHARQHM